MSRGALLGQGLPTLYNSSYSADIIYDPQNNTDFNDTFLPTLEEMVMECTSDDVNQGCQTSKVGYEQAIRELGVLNTALIEHASKLPSYAPAANADTPALAPRPEGFTA